MRHLAVDHTVGTIVVEQRERLSRFGFEFSEAAPAWRGVLDLVVNERKDDLWEMQPRR